MAGQEVLSFSLLRFWFLIVLAFNIDLEKVTAFLKGVSPEQDKTDPAGIKINRPEAEEKNLQKIKDLREDKKKKKKKAKEEIISAEELMTQEEEEQTRIRIIRKDAGQESFPKRQKRKQKLKDEDIIQKSETKKVDLEKTGEMPERDLT